MTAEDERCDKNEIPKQRQPEQNENTARRRAHDIGSAIVNQFRHHGGG